MCSLQTLRGGTVRLALSCSLIFACAICMAGPYTDLKQKLDRTHSDAEVLEIVAASPAIAHQKDIATSLTPGLNEASAAASLRAKVDLASMAESPDPAANSAEQEVRQIKDSPFYRDPGIEGKRNWLAEALDRLKNIHFDMDSPKTQGPSVGFLGPAFTVFIWGFLGMGVCTLVYFAVKHINWQSTLTRKTKALLEDDEPDRTLDEWLQLADHHAADGRYREAVRALYLACLLKFDENDVARFDRGETNWEHLLRIEESPRLPHELDFRTPTQRFDRIWYGYQTEGMPDVNQFREWYQQISESLKGVPA